MKKLNEIIEKMSLGELQELLEKEGNGKFREIIQEQIAVKNTEEKTCPVCASMVNEESLTLHFGEKNFRRKASFCAYDCLLYFAKNTLNKEESTTHIN